jgi:eukaryotic-like serine/threonine-protein kinase
VEGNNSVKYNACRCLTFFVNIFLKAIHALVLILWACLAPLASAQQGTGNVHNDWREFHRRNMKRWNPYEHVLNVHNVGHLRLKWSFNSEGGLVDSSPAVANGRVYLGLTLSPGNGILALDARTGAKLWGWSIATLSSPAVADVGVYFGGADGEVHALNAITGNELWWYATGYLITSSPTLANGVVYIGSGDGNVYALDAMTGTLLWSFNTFDGVYSSPAVVNGVVYVGSDDNNLLAIDARTGTLLWNYRTDGIVRSSPAVVNGVVYFGSEDGKFYALDAKTGNELWSVQFASGGGVQSSPAVLNAAGTSPDLYVGNDDGSLYAFNARTGSGRWSYPTGGPLLSSPAVANGVVYFGSDDHNVYALNANTGAKLWSYTTGDKVESSPTVVDGVVYVGSEDGYVYAFDVKKHGRE